MKLEPGIGELEMLRHIAVCAEDVWKHIRDHRDKTFYGRVQVLEEALDEYRDLTNERSGKI